MTRISRRGPAASRTSTTGRPPDLAGEKTALPRTRSRPEDRWTAAARTADLWPDTPALAARLEALGFRPAGPRCFVHRLDGSWVVVTDRALIRGIGERAFSDAPRAPRPAEVRRWDALPAMRWQWWEDNNQAIASLPFISDERAARPNLQALGFRQFGRRWAHPDGSWVDFRDGLRLGWQQWSLGELPFNNRLGED